MKINFTWALSFVFTLTFLSAQATEVNNFSDLTSEGDFTFAQDIIVDPGTPSVTLLNATVDGANHSLTGVQGTYLNMGSHSSTNPVTLRNIGSIEDGTAEDNTFSYQNANGDTIYKKITQSFNSFHKTSDNQNNISGTVNIENSVFANNLSDQHAGLFYADSNAHVNIINSTFYNNRTAENFLAGGVMWTDTSGNFIINSSLFVSNSAGEGGVFNISAPNYISNSIFANNQATVSGGGAIWYDMAAVSMHYQNYIINSEFINNTALNYLGGALYFNGINDGVHIMNTSFIGNSASYGGAILVTKYREVPFSIVDSSFKNNSAVEGAAIYNANNDLNIFAVNKDVLFDGNTANNESSDYNAGSDIYFEASENDATLSLNAASGRKIIFNGSIASYTDGTVANIDINKSGLTYSPDIDVVVPMVSDDTSEIQFNNRVGDATYNFDINLYGGILSIGQNATTNASIANPDGFIDGNNLNVVNNATLYTINNIVGSVNLKNLDLASNLNIQVDADLAESEMDTIHTDTLTGDSNIVVSGVNILTDAEEATTVVQFTDGDLTDHVSIQDDLEVSSPLYSYSVADNGDGTLTFTRSGNTPDSPSIFEQPVAANMALNIQDHINNLLFHDFNLSGYNELQKGRAGGDEAKNKNIWFKIYGFNDKSDYKEVSDVKTKTFMAILGFNKEMDIFEEVSSNLNVYGGYVYGNIRYNNIKIDQPGEYLGLNLDSKYKNLILSFNLTGGLIQPQIDDINGKHHHTNPWAGVASNVGYQFYVNPYFMIEPSLIASYTYIHTDDYTNISNVKVKADAYHVFELVPNLRAAYGINKNWDIFGDVRYAFSDTHGGTIRVEEVAIPALNMAKFVEYGLGVRTHYNNYTFEVALYRRDGKREGFNGYLNLRYNF